MIIAGFDRSAHSCGRYTPSARRQSGANLRSLLLVGVASAALLAGVSGTLAEDFDWISVLVKEQPWETAGNWVSDGQPVAAPPTAGDTVNIGVGNTGIKSVIAIDTVNLNAGTLWINKNAVLNAETVNISGGRFALSKVDPENAQGVANISTLLNITSGTIERFGLIDLGDTGAVTQSGGLVANPIQIHTPTYTQSGGAMGGTVNLDTLFTLSGEGALVTGNVHGDGDATMLQLGGRMDGGVHDVASYTQLGGQMGGDVATDRYYAKGGSLAGRVNFSELFALSGDDTTVEWMDLIGARDAVMTQSGGLMAGGVYNEYIDNNSIGIATYRQSGGEMSGFVVADTYELSGGSFTGSAEFADLFALSEDGTVAWDSFLRGDGDATVTQSGGTMEATLTGVASYSQSGGTMNSTITVDKYIHSGGTISGAVTADTYELAGGTGLGFGNVTIGSTLLQSGGVFDYDGVTLPIFTQTGGLFSGTISVETYTLADAGATSTGGAITASDTFNLAPQSGTAIVEALLTGNGGIVKSGDSAVVLINAGNDFAGGVTIEAGTLDILNDALTEGAAVTVEPDAVLKLTTTTDTLYTGTMTGEQGNLVKAGAAAATLAGNIHLGDLSIDGGTLAIGTGTSATDASFLSAYIAEDATLHVKEGAKLTIRIPNSIHNLGFLINEGTVIDDLDNVGMFENYGAYIAHVASNSGTIHNNTPGVWEGNVKTNTGLISNNAGATWKGDVETNAGVIYNYGTWEGDIRGNGNKSIDTFQIIYNTGADATWTGDVTTGTTQVVNDKSATWNGRVLGNNNAVFNMLDSTWNGNVVANGGGDNHLAQIDNYGVWTGDVETNADAIFNLAGSWTGDVWANADYISNNQHDVSTNVMGVNHATWTGDVLTNSGSIINQHGGTWTGNVLANAGTITNRGTWIGDFTSAGTIIAENQIIGAVANNGLLHVTGPLAGITSLSNNGTLDMRGGGTTQTLTAANASFGAGSFYGVDVDGAGNSDNLVVTGTATLAGTVRVTAAAAGGTYDYNVLHTILTTGDALNTTFAGVTTDLAFLTPQLSYDSNAAYVALARNDQGFDEAGRGSNQKAAAAAAEALGPGNAIYDALLFLNQHEAEQAFQQLSGEVHSSAKGVYIESAAIAANAVTGRIDQAFDAQGGSNSSDSSSAGGPELATGPDRNSGLWAQLYGARAIVAANGDTGRVSSSTGGLISGIDGSLGDWRLGLMLLAGATNTAVASPKSSIASTDYGIGVYGGTQWGNTRLALGATYTRHDVRSDRDVDFPGFTDTLTASYAAGTAQAFGELSHEFDLGEMSLTPYASLAYVSHATDRFTETGGAASFTSTTNIVDATFTTLGFGVDRRFAFGDGMLLTAAGSLGWRHAFADAPSSIHTFAAGTAFSVVGAPIASDTFVLAAGLNLNVSADTHLDLSYDGQFGSGIQTHAVKGTWATRF